MLDRRCLIPASGYFEWQRTQSGGKSKQKFALYRPGQPLFMAGLWREEQGQELPVFVILTREAAPAIAQIHDRMPVILPQDACSAWISDQADVGMLIGRAVQDVDYHMA